MEKVPCSVPDVVGGAESSVKYPRIVEEVAEVVVKIIALSRL